MSKFGTTSLSLSPRYALWSAVNVKVKRFASVKQIELNNIHFN